MISSRLNRLAVLAVVTLCILVAGAMHTRADIPKLISYQGRLTDADGNPVADGDHILTFQIVEHDPLPMGESPLWSSGPQTVTTANGLFSYYLGSNVSLPTEIFNDDGLDSYFLRIQVQGSLLFLKGAQLVTVPFSVRSTYSDTAAYALAGPGGGSASGWVDDGSVVRLQSGGDRVGIGTNSPSEPLVVGGDLGSFPEANYIVSCNPDFEGFSGYKLGFNADNHATLQWYGDGDQLRFITRAMGTTYNNNLILRAGNVGIGVDYPTENLVVGRDLGSFNGNRIVVGDATAGEYTGLVVGEDTNNRGWLLWDIDNNFFAFGIKDDGNQYNDVLTIKRNRVGIGTNNPSERLVVGKDLGSYAGEVLVVGNDDAGSYSCVKLGEDGDNCANVLWSNDNNYLTINTKESGVVYDPILIRGGKLSIGDEFPFAAITSRVSGTAILGEDTPGTMGGVGVLGKSSDELGSGVTGMGMGVNGYGVNGHAYGAGGYGVYAQATSDARIALYAEANVPSGVGIEAHCGTSGMAGKFYGNVALYSPSDDHMIIMFGEGLDYAEGFHSSAPRKAEPGTVMSIDPGHPGKLTISASAYDTRVAGIVAGAGDLGSGVRLGADGFDLDVALAGRVYCNVEATQQAVQPGDLLTTSSIPGYAMKATDYDRARGAILGKAMQYLAKGEKDKILVLVTLQ